MKTNQYFYNLNDWNQELDLSLDSESRLALVFESSNLSSLKKPLDEKSQFGEY